MGLLRAGPARRLTATATTLVLLAGGLTGGLVNGPARAAPRAAQPCSGDRTGCTIRVATGTSETESGEDSEGSAAALSRDGRSIAYQSNEGSGATAIYTSDLVTGARTRVSSRSEDTMSAPSISGDGELVAYQDNQSNDPAAPTGGIRVWHRGTGTTRQVTGSSRDLPYQRLVSCSEYGNDDATYVDSCGPRLSADGTTLVYPIAQTTASPYLNLTTHDIVPRTLPRGLRTAPADDSAASTVPLLDFGIGYAVRSLTVTVEGTGRAGVDSLDLPASIHNQPGLPAGTGFAFTGEEQTTGTTSKRCSAVPVGEQCGWTITYTPDPQPYAVRYATLRLDAPTPAGQTAIQLVAENPMPGADSMDSRHSADSPDTGRAAGTGSSACPPPEGTTPDSYLPETPGPAGWDGNRTVDLGALLAGGVYFRRIDLRNVLEVPAHTQAVSSDCALTLAPPSETGSSRACGPGTEVPPGGSCVLYVAYRPHRDAFDPATLTAAMVGGDGSRSPATHIVGEVRQYSVVVRRDPDGTGAFAGTATTVVSMGGGHTPVDGRAPSVSADGRYVAFSSYGIPKGRTGPSDQVYRRDTATGTTTLVSYLPAGSSLAPSASKPSLSADGRRVAFQARTPAEGCLSGIYVRDLPTGHTVSVSGGLTNGCHTEASLSADGSTVSWQSVDSSGRTQVYARNLGPDFGGPGSTTTELISTQTDIPDADSTRPVVSSDGGVIAYLSTGTGADVPTRPTALYARLRYPTPTADRATLSFGSQASGTTSLPQTMTIGNSGPGPLHAHLTTTGPFRVLDNGCAATVHAEQTCTVQVVFVPTRQGIASGQFTATATVLGDDLGTPVTVRLTGTGAAPTAGFQVSSTSIELGAQQLGVTSTPVALRVTNTGTLPLTMTAAFLGQNTPAQFAAALGSCATVAPGASCSLRITVTPAHLGTLHGELALTAASSQGTPAQLVLVAATTRTPTLSPNPDVIHPRQVTRLSGRFFPPGVAVRIDRPHTIAAITATADESGTFDVALLLLGDENTGPTVLTATIPGVGTVDSVPLLIEPPTSQPSMFTLRR